PGRKAFDAVARFDAAVVDGAVNGTGVGVRAVAERLRRGQTGFVRNYSAIVVAGVLAVLAWFVIVRGVL
ncbi:MAG: NADH-quinone oxidoreductase subunit L, partial [Ilumatobacteraceae bacterium]